MSTDNTRPIIPTELVEPIFYPQTFGDRAKVSATIPAGRFGDPSEFGDTCAFLCGVSAAYITGQNILIDGGFCMNTL